MKKRENMRDSKLKNFNPMALREKYSASNRTNNYSSFWLDNGWVLLRPSNTQPVIRMFVEAEDEKILDIGPKTIISIKKIINESNTVLWNGPAGYFENPNFQNGTKEILESISNSRTKYLQSI